MISRKCDSLIPLVPGDARSPLDKPRRPVYGLDVTQGLFTEQAILAIAVACHQQNKAWCEAHHDHSQKSWEETPENIQASAIDGVRNALKGSTPEQSHENWLAFKRADGWSYGPVKDLALKTHPSMLPYSDLPEAEKVKDHLFIEMVQQLAKVFGLPITETSHT